MSLRSYFILLATLVMLFISAGALVLVRQLDDSNRRQAEAQLLATTHALSQAVDGQLESYRTLLSALQQSEALERRDWTAFDRQARRLLAGGDAWIVVGDRSGRQLINTRLPAGAPLPEGPPAPHIWADLDRGRSRVCNLTTGLVVPNIVCVDVPIFENGRAAYHLSVIFRPAQLSRVMQRQDLSGGKVAVVVDRRGVVIWRSRRPEAFVGRPGPAEALAEVLRKPSGLVRTPNLEGTPSIAAFSRSSVSGWSFVVAVPQAELEPGLGGALRAGLAIFAVCIALAAALAFFAAQQLARAVRRLAQSAERIRGGGGPPGWAGSGFREIDAVGRTLDRAISERDAADERFELAQEVGGIGAWEWDIPRDEGRVSAAYRRMHGLEAEEGPLRLQQVLDVIHPDDLSGYLERLSAATVRPEPSTNEYRVVQPDGSIRWIGAKGRPLFDGEGRAVSAVGIVIDMTERKAAEDRLTLLAREVDHRANNLMTVVQSAVTLSRGADVESLRENIVGRVNALARAHQLLAASRWRGADLLRVLKEELGPYALGEPDRVALTGEPVSLSPAAIQGVAMVIHELATNAAKYGALSVPSGRVAVVWRTDGGVLHLKWTETGGPRAAPPQRSGFGATVIARALAGPVGGKTHLDWRPEGLVCEIEVPLAPSDPVDRTPHEEPVSV